MPTFIDELIPDTEAWHEHRRNYIGGSDASIIAAFFIDGCDWPYEGWPGSEIYKLWSLKTGRTMPKQKTRAAADPRTHGVKTEPLARDWYTMETGQLAAPVNVISTEVPYMACSLDGWTGEYGVEIKCPTEPGSHRQAKEGMVPAQYYAQCQHNLFVTGAPKLDYVSFYRNEGVIIEVAPDPAFLDKLLQAEAEFWRWVQERHFGGIPTQKEFVIDETNAAQYENLKQLLDAYEGLTERRRAFDAGERLLKLRILQQMPAAKVKGFGRTIAVRVRAAQQITTFEKPEGLELSVRHQYGSGKDEA